MLLRTGDNLPDIQRLWPEFEELVGVHGRHMFAMVDTALDSYATCTPIRPDDDPAALGLETGTLPGGSYLRGQQDRPVGSGRRHSRSQSPLTLTIWRSVCRTSTRSAASAITWSMSL